jgi:LmbE family N-acetylglucosaminyl deacetylase
LVLSPHPDDDVLGCGGLLTILADSGSHIKCLYIYDGASGNRTGKRDVELIEQRERESITAAKILKIAEVNYQRAKEGSASSNIGKRIYEELKTGHWDLVLFPFSAEWHKDHINVSMAVDAALERLPKRVEAWGYNVWGLSEPKIVVPIDKEIKTKIEAAKEYKSQLKIKDYEDAIISANRYLGEMLGVSKYAEIYQELN